MKVSVVGATGDVGRNVAVALLAERLLARTTLLQLVGRPSSATLLEGLAVDLRDATAEHAPDIEVVTDADGVLGDIVIFCAGATVSTDPAQLTPRSELAGHNLEIFESYAASFERNFDGQEFVLVVSNPVELAVRSFARRLDPARVVGMGAHLDTLRFRREVAADLGVHRQQVQGFVLGEHGMNQVPCWSTVSSWTDRHRSVEDPAPALRDPDAPSIPDAFTALRERLLAGDPAGALADLAALPPDVRAAVKPFFVHLSGAKTAMATAAAVADLAQVLTEGWHAFTAAQVEVGGHFLGIEGVTGVPVRLSTHGAVVEELDLADDEIVALRAAADAFTTLSRTIDLA